MGIWGAVRIIKAYSFELNCSSYLKRAADSSDIQTAKKEITKVINYSEKKNLTSGVVSIFLKNPKNDIGFWYENLKKSYQELEKVPIDSTLLEQTNVLMKFRETLTDQKDDNITPTVPSGISVYPNNVAYFVGGMFSFIMALVFWILFVISYDNNWY